MLFRTPSRTLARLLSALINNHDVSQEINSFLERQKKPQTKQNMRLNDRQFFQQSCCGNIWKRKISAGKFTGPCYNVFKKNCIIKSLFVSVNMLLTFYESEEYISYIDKKLLELQGFSLLFLFCYAGNKVFAFQEACIPSFNQKDLSQVL